LAVSRRCSLRIQLWYYLQERQGGRTLSGEIEGWEVEYKHSGNKAPWRPKRYAFHKVTRWGNSRLTAFGKQREKGTVFQEESRSGHQDYTSSERLRSLIRFSVERRQKSLLGEKSISGSVFEGNKDKSNIWIYSLTLNRLGGQRMLRERGGGADKTTQLGLYRSAEIILRRKSTRKMERYMWKSSREAGSSRRLWVFLKPTMY